MGTILGVPVIRIIVFWSLYWGPLIFGRLPYSGLETSPAFHCRSKLTMRFQVRGSWGLGFRLEGSVEEMMRKLAALGSLMPPQERPC